MRIRLLFALLPLVLAGCAAGSYPANEFRIGSVTSKNIFVDASQFANRKVRLRLRNSSGNPSIDIHRIRTTVESGLRSAGYTLEEQGAGIVMDVNLYFIDSVVEGRRQHSNHLGVLLGAVAGYEANKRPGGMGPGAGALVGAIAGSTLQEVVRANQEPDSYVVLADVNLGVIRQESKHRDSFVIGGNPIERDRNDGNGTFESFAMRETVKVSVFAGDRRENRASVMEAIQDRLARIVANLI